MSTRSNSSKEVYISFTSMVNPHTAQVLMGALTNAVNDRHTKIHLRAACKTLIDSERRKNTQASNDVRARQLARF